MRNKHKRLLFPQIPLKIGNLKIKIAIKTSKIKISKKTNALIKTGSQHTFVQIFKSLVAPQLPKLRVDGGEEGEGEGRKQC